MPPYLAVLVDFGHFLGAVLGIGGLFHLGFATLPASHKLPDPLRTQFLQTLRWRGRVLTYTAVLLLLGTGLLKWIPETGGVGWLGYRGYRTAFLHGKIVLALFVFHLALKLTRKPKSEDEATRRPRQARLAAGLGAVVILLAVLHHIGL
jgi:uncharacterized membrane protein